jgi:hypothetical protein
VTELKEKKPCTRCGRKVPKGFRTINGKPYEQPQCVPCRNLRLELGTTRDQVLPIYKKYFPDDKTIAHRAWYCMVLKLSRLNVPLTPEAQEKFGMITAQKAGAKC